MSSMTALNENIRLNCTIVADTHIDIKHPFPYIPKSLLKGALKQSKKSRTPVDAFIIIGDTTSRGSRINWDMAKDVFTSVPSPAAKTLIAIGNHDTWSDEGSEEAIRRYIAYTSEITGISREKTYFSEVINGYHIIMLGGETDSGCGAYISDEQVSWFRDEIAKASESGKPAFVFCHQSINGKHGLPRTFDKDEDPNAGPMEGGIGERSDDILAILGECKIPVFFFSGHSHMGISGAERLKKEGYSSFENYGNLSVINLPSLACGNHHGDVCNLGIGVQLEVYDDSVIIRPRSYLRGKWIENVKISGDEPFFRVKL